MISWSNTFKNWRKQCLQGTHSEKLMNCENINLKIHTSVNITSIKHIIKYYDKHIRYFLCEPIRLISQTYSGIGGRVPLKTYEMNRALKDRGLTIWRRVIIRVTTAIRSETQVAGKETVRGMSCFSTVD